MLSSCTVKNPSPADGDTNASTTTTSGTITTTTTTTGDPAGDRKPEDEEKEIKNILMIGNSFCYYYVEELAGIASADGIEINVANLYKSGCTLEEHWNYYSNNSLSYEFYITTSESRGRPYVKTMQGALDFAKSKLGGDWDIITLQQSCNVVLGKTVESATSKTLSYAESIYDVIRAASPDAKLYYHQPWAYEVGYSGVTTTEKRDTHYAAIKELAYMVAEAENVSIVPTGDAWQIARANSDIGQTLCARKGVNGDLGDYEHDGDIGGGQYLNACVWYEVLLGKSCVGNTWRPSNYELSDEKIAILQNAAHAAVAQVYGADYAK